MKKTVLLFIFIAVIVTQASSQITYSDTSRNSTPKTEIRLDLSFFESLFRNQPEASSSPTLSLTGNRFISGKTFLRVDIGFGYSDNSTQKDTIPKMRYIVINQNYGIGLGREIKASKRFSFYYGGEVILESAYTKTEQPSSVVSSTGIGIQTATIHNTNYGAAAFMGVKIYLFSRISISTETKVDFLFDNSISNTVYDMMPAQNTRSTTKGFSTTYYPPATIYMNIRIGK